MGKAGWKWAALAVLAAACLAALAAQVTWAQLADALRQVSLPFVLLGLAAALLTYLLKALRFRLFLGPDARFRTVFGITVAQNVIATLLPMRAGDVSYVVMVRAAGLSAVSYGIASLILCRVLDFVILGAMYLLPLFWLHLALPGAVAAAWVVGAVVLAGTVALVSMLFFGRRMAMIGDWLLALTRAERVRAVAYVWGEVKEGTLQLGHVGAPARLAAVVVLSALIWATSAAWLWCAWYAVGVPLNVPQISFFLAAAQFFTLLPIFLPTGIGPGDALNAAILMAFGCAAGPAAAFTLCNRVLAITYTIILGLLAVALARPALRAARAAGPGENDADRKTNI